MLSCPTRCGSRQGFVGKGIKKVLQELLKETAPVSLLVLFETDVIQPKKNLLWLKVQHNKWRVQGLKQKAACYSRKPQNNSEERLQFNNLNSTSALKEIKGTGGWTGTCGCWALTCFLVADNPPACLLLERENGEDNEHGRDWPQPSQSTPGTHFTTNPFLFKPSALTSCNWPAFAALKAKLFWGAA